MSRDRDGSEATGLLCVEAREAAGMLGVSRRAVRNLVTRGELEARRDGDGAAGRVLITVASVKKLRSERRIGG
jgi:excisionase family DNA binding protein